MRYRDNSGGVTHKSLAAMSRNLRKVGDVLEIRGYRFVSTRHPKGCNPYTTDHEAVLVKGTKGTARFDGFLWGYGGTGPNGLRVLLEACGFNDKAAQAIAFNTPRKREPGTDFVIQFPVGVPI
jgi:hypothetical protein